MALYTGKGDDGTTKLFTSKKGERVSKSDKVFDTLGIFDELNTMIGWCRCACTVDWMVQEKPLSGILLDVQHALFTIQAEIAGAEKYVPKKEVGNVEAVIKIIEKEIPEITTFLVPGGSELSARLDMARASVRRAERSLITLYDSGIEITENTRTYMNRLSSLLYALVRLVNHNMQTVEQSPEYL